LIVSGVQANPLPEIIALGGYVNSEMNIYTIYPDASDFETDAPGSGSA
jgi:hypothetical protein